MTEIEELKEIINHSENIVFFGGAGVSTESGIPDFRGSAGLYTKADEDDGIPPETKLHISYLRSNPEGFYKYYRSKMFYPDAKPNAAHLALARLEKAGKLKAVITQNIDGLHQRAGSRTVYELHGTTAECYCMKCGKRYEGSVAAGTKGVPYCSSCGGVIRPDFVFYGEGLDPDVWEKAEAAVKKADTLIIGGTSLTVYPAAGIVSLFRGKKLVIINLSATDMDRYADLLIRKPIGEVLSKII